MPRASRSSQVHEMNECTWGFALVLRSTARGGASRAGVASRAVSLRRRVPRRRSMFRSSSLRMCSMALRHPDKIFTTVLPPPPPWPAPPSLSPTRRTSSSLQWKESGLDDKTLTRVLSHLQSALRSNHKRKISWPVEESSSSEYVYLTITT